MSYAHEDSALARIVTDGLGRRFDVVYPKRVVRPGENWTKSFRDDIRASDIVVALLSPASVTSKWVNKEIEYALSPDIDRRGAQLIPALIAPTELPTALLNRPVIDLASDITLGLQHLVEQIDITSLIDFDELDSMKFEGLIADLLESVGFHLERVHSHGDVGADIRASYNRTDPFGLPETDVWLVETKLYSHQRVSIQAIRNFAGALATAPGGTHGLLVTNAQVTSVARDYVRELAQRSNIIMRVLDGIELKNLLRQRPQIVSRHFGTSTEVGRDGHS
ncbi:TIR domain-containing protein [Streptomyces sp. MCC20]|uniref:TIR domain-containing protein n=1 Tax=Streptomyces sediminimaris TaxID=3383721 RepID=UPI00399AA77E